jgi:hypothetical protein
MIKLDNKTNIELIEKAHKELTKSDTVDLSLSKSISSIEFGIIPFIIQFIATWYNKTKGGRLILDLKKEDDLPEFYKLDYFFPSIVYCWERIIIDNNGKDLKPLLRVQNELQYEIMRTQSPGGGPKMLLSCFDHLSVKKGLLNAFYIDGTFISNEMQFDFALDKAVRNVIFLNRELVINNYVSVHSEIISIIYELMKNTDDWGRTDIYNKPLNPNSRGLYLKLHRQKRENYLTGFENHEGLKDYFSSENFKSNTLDELYFLEISVYDTGIGFIQRYKSEQKNNFSITEHVGIIKERMLKYNTSATGVDKEIKGQGLDRIMKILDNKGLFWLRTSNVSVFRNLRKNRYKENCSIEDVELFDWFNNSTTEFSNIELAQGSVITLVYPISNIANE